MKKPFLITLIACCLFLAGCSKDAEINSFITDFDSVTNEVVQKVNANPSAAGVDEAQKAFDAKKAGLKAKWDAIKTVTATQMSSDSQVKLKKSSENNMQALMEISSKKALDKDAGAKMDALIKDFQNTFTK
jgi:hypothetical protein